MELKKIFTLIGQILYFIFIIFVTYRFIGILYVSRNAAFLKSHEPEYEENVNLFISAISLTQTNDMVEAISEINPIYSYSFDDEINSFEIKAYSFMFFKNQNTENGILFIVREVRLNQSLYEENLNFKVNLNETLDGHKRSFSFESSILFGTTHAFLYTESMLKIKGTSNYADIISIEIDDNEHQRIVLLDANLDENFDVSHQRYDIRSKYQIENPKEFALENPDIIYYNGSLIRDLKSYNYLIVMYASIYFVIVLGITYLICIHSSLKKYLANKRTERAQQRLVNIEGK